MQNVTLPDWAAWYDACNKKYYTKTNEKTDFDNLPNDVERQDEDKGCTDTHPELNETFDHLSDNLGICSTKQNYEPLILNEMPNDEYQGLKRLRNHFTHFLTEVVV